MIDRQNLQTRIINLQGTANNLWNQFQRIAGMIEILQSLLGELGPEEATPPPPESLTGKDGIPDAGST